MVDKYAKRMFLRNHKDMVNRHFGKDRPLNPLLLTKLGKESKAIIDLAVKEVGYSPKTYQGDIYQGLKNEWLAMRSEGRI